MTCEVSYRDLELEVSRKQRREVSEEVSDRLYNLGYADMVEEYDR
jgi:hypothetical protein